MADLALSSGDFAQMATFAASHAPAPGRIALFLEGGYDLVALRSSVSATLGALLGAGAANETPTSGGPGAEVVKSTRDTRDAALRIAHDAGQ